MKLTLKIWRQKSRKDKGKFVSYPMRRRQSGHVDAGMLDVLNEKLIERGEEPVAFEHDCREGICGSCGFMINGVAHGPHAGDHGLPVDHAALQRRRGADPRAVARRGLPGDQGSGRRPRARSIASSRPAVTSPSPPASAPDGNAILVGKETADRAMDAAACIGCGACVAACPNASAALFTGAKIAHLGILPQGKPERDHRALGMVAQMNAEGFGSCTNIGECTGVCPKEIPLEVIATMNRDYIRGSWKRRDDRSTDGEADHGVEHGIEVEDRSARYKLEADPSARDDERIWKYEAPADEPGLSDFDLSASVD